MADWNRRKVLIAGGALCAVCVTGCTPGTTGDPLVEAGPATDYVAGELVALEGTGVAVGRDEAGLYALSTVCTHARCDIALQGDVSQSELVCGCHGSAFDGLDGDVLEGPASRPLPFYAVTIDDEGLVVVDTSTTVPPDERVAP